MSITLMEIARRERRRCLAMVFSDGPQLYEVELLGRGRGGGARLAVKDEAVLGFAEHFPGGGTAFEPPLRRAMEAVSEGSYRNGDIIFITDGEASISPDLVRDIRENKKKHRFSIWGLLVDMEGHQRGTLEQVADEIRNVGDLTGEALSELFTKV